MSLTTEINTLVKNKANQELNSNQDTRLAFMKKYGLAKFPASVSHALDTKPYSELSTKTQNNVGSHLADWLKATGYIQTTSNVEASRTNGHFALTNKGLSYLLAQYLKQSVNEETSTQKTATKATHKSANDKYDQYIKFNADRILKSSDLTIVLSLMNRCNLVTFPKDIQTLLNEKSYKSLSKDQQSHIKKMLPKWIASSPYVNIAHKKEIHAYGKILYRYEPYAVLTKAGDEQVLKENAKQRKEVAETNKVSGLRPKLARIYNRASHLLSSSLPAYRIQKYTGVNHSSILRLRNIKGVQGRRNGLKDVTLKTMLLLASYPNTDMPRKYHTRVSKLKYQAYLYHASAKFGINIADIKAKFADLLSSMKNVSAFSRDTGVHRLQLERIRGGKYHVMNMHVIDIDRLLQAYYHMQSK